MFSSRSARASLLLCAAFVVLLAISSTSQAILVEPGVVFMTDVGIQYRAHNPLHFGVIRFGGDHLKLDTTDLRFEYNGTFLANLTALNFLDSSATALIVVEWLGTASDATLGWFNISGLSAGAVYTFVVDTVVRGSFIADSSGSIFIPWTNTDMAEHEFAILTPYASISATDWTLILLIIFFVILLVLGFVASWFHILCGIEGFLLAYDIWHVTGDEGLTVVVAGFALLILVMGMFRKTKADVGI